MTDTLPIARTFLRLMLPPILLFGLMIGGIRAQPYDDSELRTFFSFNDCAGLCVMGVHIGMSEDEAFEVISRHPWASNVHNNFIEVGETTITWEWNDQAPSWFTVPSNRLIHLVDGRVQDLQMSGNLPLASALAYWGRPSRIINTDPYVQFLDGIASYNFYFSSDTHLRIDGYIVCPFHVKDYFESFTLITLKAGTDISEIESLESTADDLLRYCYRPS